ncbi:MAG TPA: class I SAM-dependent methyltransferase [Longimicrobium sp.]|jgi:SAM-dependent methyltransferase
MSTSPRRCRICGSEQGAREYRAREMMYGTREEFCYFQCAVCECLQICEFPPDIARFYAGYGSYDRPKLPTGLRGRVWAVRNRFTFTGRGAAGRVLQRVHPYPTLGADRWLAGRGVSRQARILDVGCGSGGLLLSLRSAGFEHLLGVEPYLEADIRYPNGVTVLKRSLAEVEGRFDVIMFHHVLEHIAEQHETMAAVAERLTDTGFCLIRIPLVSSEAWDTYREHWVQIDPPRHFFIHSLRSLALLAEGAGLKVSSVEHDSTAFQFAASELYRRGIPLVDQAGKTPPDQLREYEQRAKALNASGRGDQAAFYLAKK